MDLEKMKSQPIFYDRNEKSRKRSIRFNEYLRDIGLTEENGHYRVKTSNGEFFYFKSYVGVNLPEGDYMYNDILFEFKSKNDLALSIPERLDKQVDNVLKMDSVNQYIIISNCLKDLDFTNPIDAEWFENLKNYFNQYIPFHIHFIPCTSERICFRDMVNIWRCQQSPLNLSTLNHRYELNLFVNNLATLPCLNHNQAKAIFYEFPYSNPWDVFKLTKEEVANVKFGKKKCGEPMAEKIINQINMRYSSSNYNTHKNLINFENGIVEWF